MAPGRHLTADLPDRASAAATDRNKVRSEDRAVHEWYRFVLSFPPHLVQDYLHRFEVGSLDTVWIPSAGLARPWWNARNPVCQVSASSRIQWRSSPAR